MLKKRTREKDTIMKKSDCIINGDRDLLREGSILTPEYRFDNFVIGACNQFAHEAAVAVAKSPAEIYNPLYIYGGEGLGKTHLMKAIGNMARKKKHDFSIRYVTADQLVTEIVSSLQYDKMAELNEKYCKLDLLLIDDVQLIREEKMQDDLFHILDSLIEKHKQIIIAGNWSTDIRDRLRSRFPMGLIVDVQSSDIETKIAIIHKKAKMSIFQKLPEDVLHLLANRIESNIRELEGCIVHIAAHVALTEEDITLETIKRVLLEQISTKRMA